MNSDNNNILTINSNEYTDEFRRVQTESLGLSEQDISDYHLGKKIFTDEDRRRIGRVLERFLGTRSDGTGNGFDISLTSKEKGTTFTFVQVNGALFRDVFQINRNYLKNGELVDLHDNYDNCKCYLSNDGLCGFAIEPDGNLISVFSLNPHDKKGFLYAIKDFVKEQGATHLDAYASERQNLELIYRKTLGFKTAAKMDYNIDFDHDGIAGNHGNPNIVFMVSANANVVEKHFDKDSYTNAKAYQMSQLQTSAQDIVNRRTLYREITAGDFTPQVIKHIKREYEDIKESTKSGLHFNRWDEDIAREMFARGGEVACGAVILCRGDESTGTTHPRGSIEGERECGARQERLIEAWARTPEVDCWYDLSNLDESKLIASGGEAEVYRYDKYTVLKVNTLRYSVSPQALLDRIAVQNYLCPDAALNVIGFGRNPFGEFCVVSTQPYILGRKPNRLELEELVRELSDGKVDEYTKHGGHNYKTPYYLLDDLHEENIIIDKETGTPMIIDSDIRFNTPELGLGGKYRIPTVEFDYDEEDNLSTAHMVNEELEFEPLPTTKTKIGKIENHVEDDEGYCTTKVRGIVTACTTKTSSSGRQDVFLEISARDTNSHGGWDRYRIAFRTEPGQEDAYRQLKKELDEDRKEYKQTGKSPRAHYAEATGKTAFDKNGNAFFVSDGKTVIYPSEERMEANASMQGHILEGKCSGKTINAVIRCGTTIVPVVLHEDALGGKDWKKLKKSADNGTLRGTEIKLTGRPTGRWYHSSEGKKEYVSSVVSENYSIVQKQTQKRTRKAARTVKLK